LLPTRPLRSGDPVDFDGSFLVTGVDFFLAKSDGRKASTGVGMVA